MHASEYHQKLSEVMIHESVTFRKNSLPERTKTNINIVRNMAMKIIMAVMASDALKNNCHCHTRTLIIAKL